MLIALSTFALTACASIADSNLQDFDRRNNDNYLRIEVTGSRIPRYIALDNRYPATSFPVQIVTRADIDSSGASDLCSLLSGGC